MPLSVLSSISGIKNPKEKLFDFLYYVRFLTSSNNGDALVKKKGFVLLVGNSSGAKSDMDMAYERARVHFGSEDAASSPIVGKVCHLL